jgi:type IV pilus assembly protein PilC
MPGFHYTAIDGATGGERTGEIAAADAAAAAGDLRKRGLFPTELAPVAEETLGTGGAAGPAGPPSGALRRRFRQPARIRERAVFTRQLTALVGAGMPLVRGLDLLARQQPQPAWRDVIADLAGTIRAGGTLSSGLRRHPRLFDRLYVGMIRAGEAGGTLDAVLDRLARHLEKADRVKARVKSAMIYPLVIMAVAMAIVTALMAFVVPRFEAVFAGVLKGAPLPVLTQAVLRAGRLAGAWWPLELGAAVLLPVAARWVFRSADGGRIMDRMLLGLPLVGSLALKASVARFGRTLGTMLASGVSILEALQLARDTCGNRAIAAALGTVHRRVREGEGIARPLAEAGLFPPIVAGMAAVGEETSALPDLLLRLAEMYDDEVDRAVTSLTALLEPAMIVVMAVVVGTIVIALFLPIVRIIQLLS